MDGGTTRSHRYGSSGSDGARQRAGASRAARGVARTRERRSAVRCCADLEGKIVAVRRGEARASQPARGGLFCVPHEGRRAPPGPLSRQDSRREVRRFMWPAPQEFVSLPTTIDRGGRSGSRMTLVLSEVCEGFWSRRALREAAGATPRRREHVLGPRRTTAERRGDRPTSTESTSARARRILVAGGGRRPRRPGGRPIGVR